jgi:hypothetical protein
VGSPSWSLGRYSSLADSDHGVLALLTLIYSSIQVSDVLVLTVRCKHINFVFQIFPIFIPEISAGFTSYLVQIIPIYFSL